MSATQSLRIGVDIGGVCSIRSDDYESENKRVEIFDVKGCVESLQILRGLGHKLYIISFCGRKRAQKTRGLIEHYYPELFEQLFFTKKKTYKNDVCLKVGCDVMIDDKEEVLATITQAHKIHFEGKKYLPAKNWGEVLRIIKTLTPCTNNYDPSISLDGKAY